MSIPCWGIPIGYAASSKPWCQRRGHPQRWRETPSPLRHVNRATAKAADDDASRPPEGRPGGVSPTTVMNPGRRSSGRISRDKQGRRPRDGPARQGEMEERRRGRRDAPDDGAAVTGADPKDGGGRGTGEAGVRNVRNSSRGGGGGGQRDGGGGGGREAWRQHRQRGGQPEAVIAVAKSLAASLRRDASASSSAGIDVDVDARVVGQSLADCKDARTEEASDAAWELYEAAVQCGVADRFSIREYNFALGAVQQGVEGGRRVAAIWEAVARRMAAVTPNGVTMALLARGLCRGSSDVISTLSVLREGISRGAPVDAYVLNVLLNACLKDAAALATSASRRTSSLRKGGGGGGGGGVNEASSSASDATAAARVREAALAVWEAGKGMHNERTLTSTIKVLADAGDERGAEEVFEGAWEDGVPVDVDCLAVMLRIMSSAPPPKARASRDVVSLYRRAQDERGLEPTTACANIVLTACSRDGNWKAALSLWRHMLKRRSPAPDKASLAAVILSCGRSGRGDLALAAFEEGKACDGVECDTVTVNVLLDACAKSDRPPGDALDILMDALESQIPVDACTISSLLTAYATPRNAGASSSSSSSSSSSTSSRATPPPPARASASALAPAPAPARDILDQAFAIVELGKFLQVDPTPGVINSLLRVCVAAGDMARAVRAFEETAVTQGVEAVDSTSVRILIEGFAQAGDIPGAVETLEGGAALGVVISEATVVALIDAAVNAGDVETAMAVYRDATRGRGAVDDDRGSAPPLLDGGPSLAMVNALLRGLARSGSWQEAIRLVSDDVLGVENVWADEQTMSLFAEAFEVGGEVEQAKVARSMGIWLQGSQCRKD